jgi:hypothetical protein
MWRLEGLTEPTFRKNTGMWCRVGLDITDVLEERQL